MRRFFSKKRRKMKKSLKKELTTTRKGDKIDKLTGERERGGEHLNLENDTEQTRKRDSNSE